jgi:predicted nucleotidyltransferase
MKKSIIKKIITYLSEKPVLRAYIFGSVARNESDENSDIDIMVDLDYSKSIGLEFIEMQLDLEEILDRKVDLLSSNAVSKYIKPFIEKDKILIYEK